MANEVYLVTHDSLSNIISARAASRVLDKALKGSGLTQETVNHQQMHNVLVGPVLKELQQILPSEGVKRTIQHTTQLLSASSADTTITETDLELPSEDTEQSFSLLNSTEVDAPVEPKLKPNPLLSQKADRKPSSEKTTFESEELEQILLEFAQLEHVQTVATVKQANGEVLSSRGSGFDLTSLSRLANMSLSLLGRHGKLRSYHLEQAEHHLFLVPLGAFVMIIVGASAMNVGEVFSMISSVKEAA